ncbi:tRNA (adenine22-N1)-methyltransferase [Paenibacillus sp. UNCCL117]|uniref:tRNA (adenine(22)-N(1))-methyltransferase n=1 Tax=unclassified Paenibacillus TaxID=185978 RepID=UPI000883D924|nr:MULTISPECIES: tRNA (adenine(22)-N(1))-methyltransferase TrmK [unclassified Paenibacillus]SDC72794.1 tRNA (adenine22-N1)-methyltransferase [Paenibacillus sp. cl123]SFW24865.1 tRNA (adenine22-N1)-methyltransferase [Paenibacillus sp. UNCCL117]
MIRLSKRLELIANQVPQGSRLADIGSDHALLPSYLASQGVIGSGVAGEVNSGPYEAASRQVRSAGLKERIAVRLGDGLAVIEPGEVDVITIAGMGGALIVSILEAGKAKLRGVSRLVLQPNVGEDAVRGWLADNGWLLIGEQILEEDGKIYEILTAEKASEGTEEAGRADSLYEPRTLAGGLTVSKELLIRMGPYLIDEASSVWKAKWRLELDKLEHICSQVARSDTDAARVKERELRAEMRRIEEVLEACTPKDKPSFN